jgi:hypothetical protein
MKKLLLAFMVLMIAAPTVAQESKSPRQLARKLYISLTGVSPSGPELDLLQDKIARGDARVAALDIIDQRAGVKNNGAFYSVTVKDMVTPWTNRDRSTLYPLNDTTATIIGYIRDNRQFNNILFENSVYMAAGVQFRGGGLFRFQSPAYPTISGNLSGLQVCQRDLTTAEHQNNSVMKIIYRDPLRPNEAHAWMCRASKHTGPELQVAFDNSAYYVPHLDVILETHQTVNMNTHYESVEKHGLDLSDSRLLVRLSQEGVLQLPINAVSGLLTTRGYANAYVIAGTNRAPIAYAMEHFLCKDMEELNDTTIPDFRNRRDVDRSPGGTSSIYKNRCVGCHAGMDALAGAFAYYDYVNGKLEYKAGQVSPKMNHNIVFPDGFITETDQWMNLWVEGANSSVGWPKSRTVGEGVNSLGRMLSETQAFHSCMAKQVYEKVCFRKASTQLDRQRVAKLTSDYINGNFNMKNLFINASLTCMED